MDNDKVSIEDIQREFEARAKDESKREGDKVRHEMRSEISKKLEIFESELDSKLEGVVEDSKDNTRWIVQSESIKIRKEISRPNYAVRAAGVLAFTLAGFGLFHNDHTLNDRIIQLRSDHDREVVELRLDYEERLKTANERIDEAKTELTEKDKEIEDLAKQNRDDQEFLTQRVGTLEDNLEKFDEIEGNINTITQLIETNKVDALQSDEEFRLSLDKTNHSIEEVTGNVTYINDNFVDRTNFRAGLEGISTELKKIKSEQSELQGRVGQVEEDYTSLSERVEKVEPVTGTVVELSGRVSEVEEDYTSLSERVTELRKEYSASLEESREENTKLNNNINEITQRFLSLEDKFQRLDIIILEKLQPLTEQLETYGSRLSNIETNLPQLEQRVRDEVSSSLEELKVQVAQYEGQLNGIKQDYVQKDRGIADLRERTIGILRDLEVTRENVNSLSLRVDGVDIRVDGNASSLEEAKSNYDSQFEAITKQQEITTQKINGLEGSILTVTTNFEGLETSVNDLQTNINTFREEADTRNTELDSRLKGIEHITRDNLADQYLPTYISNQKGGKIIVTKSDNPREALISYFEENFVNRGGHDSVTRGVNSAIDLYGGTESFIDNYLIPRMAGLSDDWQDNIRGKDWSFRMNPKK